MLDEQIAQELRNFHERRVAEGRIPSDEQLAGWHAVFRERFGPERLARLDGEALLTLMHDHGNRDSLVYWLEFKDDEEFPDAFGSIAGGSALKFGIYRRKETGQWMTGAPSRQVQNTVDQAVEVARRHRDQLIRAAALIAALPATADEAAYQALQASLEREAPDVQDTAWGHKYLFLLFPDKLDAFHGVAFQRHHLIKLLQLPPKGNGRYICAAKFAAIARELGISIWQLTTLLHERNGRPHQYWRIGTSDGTARMNRWQPMLEGNYIAIGWHELGDLSSLTPDQASKDALKELASQRYTLSPPAIGNLVPQVFNFATAIRQGDLVITASGAKMLAIGRVTGPYMFDSSAPADFPHRRPVEWLHVGEFHLPIDEGLQSSVRQLGAEHRGPCRASRPVSARHRLHPDLPADDPLRLRAGHHPGPDHRLLRRAEKV